MQWSIPSSSSAAGAVASTGLRRPPLTCGLPTPTTQQQLQRKRLCAAAHSTPQHTGCSSGSMHTRLHHHQQRCCVCGAVVGASRHSTIAVEQPSLLAASGVAAAGYNPGASGGGAGSSSSSGAHAAAAAAARRVTLHSPPPPTQVYACAGSQCEQQQQEQQQPQQLQRQQPMAQLSDGAPPSNAQPSSGSSSPADTPTGSIPNQQDAPAAISHPGAAAAAGGSTSSPPAAPGSSPAVSHASTAPTSSSNRGSPGSGANSGSKGLTGLQKPPVRPTLDPLAAQQAVQRWLAQQQQQQGGQQQGVAGGSQQQQQQQSKPQHLLPWRRQRPLLPQLQEQEEQDAEQQQQPDREVSSQTVQQQQPSVQQQLVAQDTLLQQQQQQQRQTRQLEQQQQLHEQQQYLTSPVSFVAAQTHPRRLAGSLAACFAVHTHQLLFASGPLALANSLKGLATVRGMVTPTGGGGGSAEPAYNILVQPTIRSRAAGRSSYALDIAKVGPLPLPAAGTTRDKGHGSANAAMLHLTSSSNEHIAARNLVDNMPKRGQTVLRVAGPYALETAVLAVAIARPMMVAAWGQDLALLVVWSANKAYNGSKTGLLLSVFRCAVGSFPPEVQTEPPSGPIEEQAELWQRARNRSRRQRQKFRERKQQQQQDAENGGGGSESRTQSA